MIKIILGEGEQAIDSTDFELLLRFPRNSISAKRLQDLLRRGVRLQMDDEVCTGESQLLPDSWEIHAFSADTPIDVAWGSAVDEDAINAAAKQLEATLNKMLGGEDE